MGKEGEARQRQPLETQERVEHENSGSEITYVYVERHCLLPKLIAATPSRTKPCSSMEVGDPQVEPSLTMPHDAAEPGS